MASDINRGGPVRLGVVDTNPYLRSLGGFARTITSRYRALLADLAETPEELHLLVILAMVSGELDGLHAWLDARHGAGAFSRRFHAPAYGVDPLLSPATGPGTPPSPLR